MFKNYLLRKNISIAARSLKKDLPYAITNLAGLTIGITCCLLILCYVRYELSFDQFHTKKDRIYRVNYDILMGGSQTVSPSVPVFVAPTLKKKFPEVEDVTRFMPSWGPRTIRKGNIFFDENGFAWADPNFFKIFDFKPVAGNLSTALSLPHTLVITRSAANKYFGHTDPIGQTLLVNSKDQYAIAAVIEDVPSNSHLSFDFLTSLYSIQQFDSMEMKEEWNNPNYSTYVLLAPKTNVNALYTKIDQWVNGGKHASSQASQNSLHLRLEPMNKVHFDTQVVNFKNVFAVSDPKYIRIFVSIAIMVLLIACANYINLSTAKSSGRAKEVGIRKTIGARLPQLFMQFLSESFLLTLFATLVSIAAAYALLPLLDNLLGKQIPFSIVNADFLPYVAAGIVLISLLAGFYPSIMLTRFKPVDTLKGSMTKNGESGIFVRKSLVVLQFTIAVALIIGAIVVKSQLDFMQSTKLGLDKEHVLVIHGNSELSKKLGSFGNDVRNISGVQDVSLTWRSPFETVIGNGFSIKSNPTSNDDWHVVGGIAGDEHYLSTLGISLLAGRNFDPSKIKGDSTVNEYIVNEAFLRHYNIGPNDALGKEVVLGLTGKGTVVGVMKDFHFSSMHDAIGPVVLFNNPGFYGSILVRVGSGKLPPVLSGLAGLWKAAVPDRPFSYSFLNDDYDAMYRTEQKISALMSVFCGVAILVTCLGLLGLMAFMVAQRNKEIGIRKVLGASVFSITTMLSKDFIKLVAIAIVIASPVAWYLMHGWLQDFAFRINIHWYIFAITGIAAILIALITISLQSVKAAVANPIKSLRTE